GLTDYPGGLSDVSAGDPDGALALRRRGAASRPRRPDADDLRARPVAPRRAAEAHPDASFRVLARRDSPAHIRLRVPGRGRHASSELDICVAAHGDPVRGGDSLLHPPITMHNRLGL